MRQTACHDRLQGMSSAWGILASMKINWNQSERTAVKGALKQLIQANKFPRRSWAHLLYVAQHDALHSDRWRKEACLAPNIFLDSKTNESRWGSPRVIVFDALQELGLIPQEQGYHDPLPPRQRLRMPPPARPGRPPESSTVPAPEQAPSHPLKEVDQAIQRLRELEKQHAEALTRLEQLEAAVGQITDFITSHGYAPAPGPDSTHRILLAKGFAA